MTLKLWNLILCLIFIPQFTWGGVSLLVTKGSVVLESQGERISGSEGDRLPGVSWIETNKTGYAELEFSDGTQMTLYPSTRLNILDFRYKRLMAPKFILEIENGKIRFYSGNTGVLNPKQFKILTGVGTIGIRGSAGEIALEGSFLSVRPLFGHILSVDPERGERVFLANSTQVTVFDIFGSFLNLDVFSGANANFLFSGIRLFYQNIPFVTNRGRGTLPLLPTGKVPFEIALPRRSKMGRRKKLIGDPEGFRDIPLERERPNLKETLRSKLYLGLKEIKLMPAGKTDKNTLILKALQRERPNTKSVLEKKAIEIQKKKTKNFVDFLLEKRKPR